MRKLRVCAVALAILGMASLATGQGFQEDFESYAVGSDLHGQGGWKGWDNSAAAGAPVSDAHAYSGTKSVDIVPSADLVHEFAATGGRWEFSAMQYIPSGTTGVTDFILMNTYHDGGPQDWSIQTEFDLATGNITPWHTGVSATIVYDAWVEVKFAINLEKNMVDEYYNGELIFTDQWDDTGNKTFQAIDLYGNNASSVYYDDIKLERVYVYKAQEPNPADGATGVLVPLLRWTKGDMAALHDVYFGTTPELTEADIKASHQPAELYYHVMGLQAGVTYYWRVDEIAQDGTVTTGDVWSFTAAPVTAYNPSPRNGDKWMALDTNLAWAMGQGAKQNELYFGTDLQAVAGRDPSVFRGIVAAPAYNPGALAENTTYYWVVDETNGTKQMGEVWRFTTTGPGGGVRAEYFQNRDVAGAPFVSRIEPDINHSWGEGEVAGGVSDNISARWIADLEIALADTYTFITTSDDGVRLWLDGERLVNNWTDHGTTDNRSRAMYLEPGIYSLRMEWYENGGGAVAQLSWETPSKARQIIPAGPLQPPVRAKAWNPRSGSADVPQDVVLMWLAGQSASKHDVYFGEDEAALAAATPADAVYQGQQGLDETSFDPGTLEWGKTYFWRIDEVNDVNPDSPWVGTVWNFTTAEFLVVDNFESYTDDFDAGQAIWQTWIDGQENLTGATVGYWESANGTFGETTIVHSGRQSMPLDYNNVASPYYAEASRTWSPARDLRIGTNTLRLWVRGRGSNQPAALYVAMEDSAGHTAAVGYGDDTAVTLPQWFEWNVPLSEFTGVDLSRVKTMYIGLGDRDNPVPGGTGRIYIDDVQVR